MTKVTPSTQKITWVLGILCQEPWTKAKYIAYYTTVAGIRCPFSFLSSQKTIVPSPVGVGQDNLILPVNGLREEVMCFASGLRQ